MPPALSQYVKDLRLRDDTFFFFNFVVSYSSPMEFCMWLKAGRILKLDNAEALKPLERIQD